MNYVPTSKKQITVVGSANVDLTFRSERFPNPGETISGTSMQQGMGGKGANQAVVAARLGAHVSFVARVGKDGFGTQAIQAYQADGIDTAFVQQSEHQPTGTAAIMVDDAAENCIIVVAGANAELTPDDVRLATCIQDSAVVLCQLETPVKAAVAAFKMARSAGALTMLTPAPAENVTDELLSLCEVGVPNRTEIASLVGQSVDTSDDAIHAAKALQQRGVRTVALTMGNQGVWVLDESGPVHIPAIKVDAVDTTGAGDAFTAALAVFLADGLAAPEAATRAARVAAMSVMRPGTQTSFPTLEEVNAWDSSARTC
ncbi:MAG: ribokinase [Rhodopirellula sp. JB055]|uniref:ribokinase n=1 Tax=Rhodopirellula sp. JB055 TaxID=3342846 RepID=UPI00370BE4A5